MTHTLSTNRFSSHAAHGVKGSKFSLGGILNLVEMWSAVARQRSRLGQLDADRLRDIGLDRDSATREAARPFWDTPAGWKREGHF